MTAFVNLAPTTGVVSSRPLRAEAVARVLEHATFPVLRDDAAFDADVLVLVDADANERARVRATGRPVVMLVSSEPTGERLVDLVESGAHAMLARACEPNDLFEAVRDVGAGATGLTGAQTRQLVDALQTRAQLAPDDAASITKREREILVAIEAGLSVKQTAIRLHISPRTVENTQRVLFRKLGVRNRSQAVARALDAGVLGSSPGEERP